MALERRREFDRTDKRFDVRPNRWVGKQSVKVRLDNRRQRRDRITSLALRDRRRKGGGNGRLAHVGSGLPKGRRVPSRPSGP